MKIDFTKHSNEDIMEEIVRAKLFADASRVKIPNTTVNEQLVYQDKVFQAYGIVLDYITNRGDKRLKMFDTDITVDMKVPDEY